MDNSQSLFQFVSVQSVWVATFTLFILWLLGLLLSPFIIRFSQKPISTAEPSESQETVAKTPSPWQARIANYTRASRDAFLLLFATTVANQTGTGVSEANLVLTWIVFGLLIVWIVLQFFNTVGRWIIEAFLLLVVVILQIINFAMAWKPIIN